MGLSVVADCAGHRIEGPGDDIDVVNSFLEHLSVRNFSPATRRAYAFDLLNFLRFLSGRALRVGAVVPTDLFDYLDWQPQPRGSAQSSVVVKLSSRTGAASATMNRRIAAVRGLFEYAVVAGVCAQNPVPAARRSTGVRAQRRGLLGHLGPGRSGRGAGRLVRAPKRLPEALEAREVAEFVADLSTARDRAMALLMLLGGLRAMEVRGLLLADVDLGLRRVRVLGKGGKERTVPVDPEFFTELAIYLRRERPPGCGTRECFVVLRGRAMTEAGMRKIYRTHRARAGTPRVRPHRLRHTYGTQLASAGMDLLVLRELMGHASPETTARAPARHHRPPRLGSCPQDRHHRPHSHLRPQRTARRRSLGLTTPGPRHPSPAQRLLRAAAAAQLPARQCLSDLPDVPDYQRIPAPAPCSTAPDAGVDHRCRSPRPATTRRDEPHRPGQPRHHHQLSRDTGSSMWENLAFAPLTCLLYAASPTATGLGMRWVLEATENVVTPVRWPMPMSTEPSWAQAALWCGDRLFEARVLGVLNMEARQRDSVKMTVTKALTAWLRTSIRDRGLPAFDPDFLDDPSATLYVLSPPDGTGQLRGARPQPVGGVCEGWVTSRWSAASDR